MSASVTSTVSANGLLSLDIIFTAPGALVLRRLRILCNGELVCYVQPREWITVDGTGKLAISYLGPTYSGRHVAHVPLTMYPNTTLAFSVNADYLTYANWNTGVIEQTDTCPDVVVANTFNVPDNVIGPTIFPVGAIVAPITLTFDVPLTIDSAEVPVTVFAEDDNAVTGYVVTTTATPPYANDLRWSETAPTNYTLSSPGAHTLYAWAKDADGNVSDAVSAAVTATFTPTATSGTFDTPQITLQPAVAAPTLAGIQRGSFATPSASLRPVVSTPTVTGVQQGSFSTPSVSLRPDVEPSTLQISGVGISSGTFTLPVLSLRPMVSPPSLLGMTGGGSIRAPSGQLLNLRRIDGSPLTILSI